MKEQMECEVRLKNSGLKATKVRKAILAILIRSSQPMAAEEIFLALKEEQSTANLSTVYRTLESLVNKDLVSKISIMNNDRMLFEYNQLGHRHYLICVTCKKIVTVQNCPLGSYERTLEDETHFNIIGHRLYLYGYCEDCQRRNADN